MGDARGIGMKRAGRCFTVLKTGVLTEEATSEQT